MLRASSAAPYSFLRPVRPFFSEIARKQCVDPDAGADADGNRQKLNGEGIGEREIARYTLLSHVDDECRIYDVIFRFLSRKVYQKTEKSQKYFPLFGGSFSLPQILHAKADIPHRECPPNFAVRYLVTVTFLRARGASGERPLPQLTLQASICAVKAKQNTVSASLPPPGTSSICASIPRNESASSVMT